MKKNIFRITYTLKNDYMKEPLISQVLIKSKKEQHEINFEEIIKKYTEILKKKKFIFRSITIIEYIGKE